MESKSIPQKCSYDNNFAFWISIIEYPSFPCQFYIMLLMSYKDVLSNFDLPIVPIGTITLH